MLGADGLVALDPVGDVELDGVEQRRVGAVEARVPVRLGAGGVTGVKATGEWHE